MIQTTKIRKYKNNYNQTYGRITLNEKITRKFINKVNTDVLDVVVKYDEKQDALIIKKLDENYDFDEE